jgi:FdhE protein
MSAREPRAGGPTSLPLIDGAFGGVAPETPPLVLPRVEVVFSSRATRLRTLAPGHAARPWLEALAALCDAQQAVIDTGAHERVEALLRIAARMSEVPLPAAASDAVARVRGATGETRRAWATALDEGVGEAPDAGVALFVAAGLQVEHTARAASLRPADVPRTETDCPVCRAPAAAGVITGDAKARYLACSRCASAWHRVRVQCITCGAGSGLTYFALEDGRAPGAKAEACAHCRTYVKLFYEEDRPGIEPLADDAATLALDVLLGEAGWARGGANPLIRADFGR